MALILQASNLRATMYNARGGRAASVHFDDTHLDFNDHRSGDLIPRTHKHSRLLTMSALESLTSIAYDGEAIEALPARQPLFATT